MPLLPRGYSLDVIFFNLIFCSGDTRTFSRVVLIPFGIARDLLFLSPPGEALEQPGGAQQWVGSRRKAAALAGGETGLFKAT